MFQLFKAHKKIITYILVSICTDRNDLIFLLCGDNNVHIKSHMFVSIDIKIDHY